MEADGLLEGLQLRRWAERASVSPAERLRKERLRVLLPENRSV